MTTENGTQLTHENDFLESERQRLLGDIKVTEAKLARLRAQLAGLCHKRARLHQTYAKVKLAAGGVSVRCEECGQRFSARSKAARFCLECNKKRRTSWHDLNGGSFHG